MGDMAAGVRYLVIEKQEGTPVTTKWISGGNERSVTTERRGDEDLNTWLDRHDQEVAAAKARYPEDPATP